MLKVMTEKHALLYRTISIYCFHFPRKNYKYLRFYKKRIIQAFLCSKTEV